MARIAECDGVLWEVLSVANDLKTGQSLVILREHLTISQLLDRGCTYGAIGQWVISMEDFREMFRWHNVKV